MNAPPQPSPILEDLPPSLRLMAQKIPLDTVLLLVEHYGGTRLTVPRTISEDHALAKVLGIDAARLLVAVHRGCNVEIPNAERLRRQVRNREILRQHRQGLSVSQLARAFRLNIRTIRTILRTAGA